MNTPTPSMSAELILPLVGVILGWILGEGTHWLREVFRRRRLRKALLVELEDLGSWLDRARRENETALRATANLKLPASLSLAIPTHVYDKYFAEISPWLSRSERFSYASIFGLVREINGRYAQAGEWISESTEDNFRIREVHRALVSAYENTETARWQVQYHLRNKRSLDIRKVQDSEVRELEEQIREGLNAVLRDPPPRGGA